MRSFSLGLLYPAVLGTMIVLLFLRVASLQVLAIGDVAIMFGILVAMFYSFGFVHSERLSHYNVRVFAIDCMSGILIFSCYHLLGLNAVTPHQISSSAQELWLFYLALLPVVLTPIIRRKALSCHVLFSDFRDYISFAASLCLAVPLIGVWFSWPSLQLDAFTVWILLSLLFLAYVFDVWKRGMNPDT